ncbi:MAG: HAD-IIIA family hydrolase [Sphingobacteriaceae bacterium]|nr:HAD-IIIA family hydrolase [Cytophagaceae bacterium]
MKAVILAGGKGTRLGLSDLPKPMVPLAGKPLLEWQIRLLARYDIREIFLLTGFLAEKIEAYFGNGSAWGVRLHHVREETPLGTAGALRQLADRLDERFLVLYGDVVMDLDFDVLLSFDAQADSIGTLLVHPNDHPYDSDLVETGPDDRVTRFLSKPHPTRLRYRNLVNAAVYVLSPEVFRFIEPGVSSDFGKDIFPKILAKGGTLRAYASPEYVKDLGTPDRLARVERDWQSGKIARLNRRNPRPAVFLDRDGVLNREVDHLRRADDLDLLPGVAGAVKRLNQSDYLSVVVTNQPGLAKGFFTETDLEEIHRELETQLGAERAYLDAIYHCPHHPEAGFEGEVPALKIACDCRKPGTGLVERALHELNIDRSRSFFVGDSTTDLLTGRNAGLRTVLVRTGYGGQDGRFEVEPDFVADDLAGAVDFILNGE